MGQVLGFVTQSTGWEGYGGGIFLQGSRVTLQSNLFRQNTASMHGQGWGGGAHLAPLGSLTLDGNVFLQNVGTTNPGTASWGGGLYLTEQPPITPTNNAFVGNEASSAGSGVYIAQVAVRLRYTTFMKNSGGDGSALCITGSAGSAQMVNSIFAGHSMGFTIMAGARAVLDYTLWSANDTNAGPGVVHTHDFAGNSAFAADGYHLASSSAALGQALDIGVNQDIDG